MPETRDPQPSNTARRDEGKRDIPEERVAAPRDAAAKDEAEGLTRLIANDPADDANPRATHKEDEGVEEAVEEKVVEGAVEAATEEAATDWTLTPHSI